MKFSYRHQSTGKLYPYLVFTGHLMARALFRKVHVYNRMGVPADKPVLLAANHPTAALEPYLLCTYLDPPIYNMTRGDIFRKPFFRKFMESINMFPVFRKRDGYVDKDRNDAVFEYCVDQLRKKRIVTIYVEGEHKLVKRVRPVQKGLARIAFAAYERFRDDDLQIIPAGCNYVYGDRWRDEAFMNIGEPIYVRDYWDDYQRDPGGTLLRLCRHIEAALKPVCYHIEHPDDDALVEQMLELFRSDHPEPLFPFVTFSGKRFTAEKGVMDRINALPAAEKAGMRNKTDAYFASLHAAGLHDDALRNPQWGSWRWMIFFLTGLLPALAGFLGSRPVAWLANWVADNKVKKVEFYSSVLISVGLIAGLVWYPLLFFLTLISWNPLWIGLVLLLPTLGWFAVIYRDVWVRWTRTRRALRHPDREKLLQQRAGIGTG